MKTDCFDIWRIKNRWLRAAVAWPLAVGTAVCAVVYIIGATVACAAKGAWRAVADRYAEEFGPAERKEWAPLAASAWAAMTAKDEPA